MVNRIGDEPSPTRSESLTISCTPRSGKVYGSETLVRRRRSEDGNVLLTVLGDFIIVSLYLGLLRQLSRRDHVRIQHMGEYSLPVQTDLLLDASFSSGLYWRRFGTCL